jgi:hypothetical protein
MKGTIYGNKLLMGIQVKKWVGTADLGHRTQLLPGVA